MLNPSYLRLFFHPIQLNFCFEQTFNFFTSHTTFNDFTHFNFVVTGNASSLVILYPNKINLVTYEQQISNLARISMTYIRA